MRTVLFLIWHTVCLKCVNDVHLMSILYDVSVPSPKMAFCLIWQPCQCSAISFQRWRGLLPHTSSTPRCRLMSSSSSLKLELLNPLFKLKQNTKLSLNLYHKHTHSHLQHKQSHTHIHAHTHSHSLSLPYSHALFLSLLFGFVEMFLNDSFSIVAIIKWLQSAVSSKL